MNIKIKEVLNINPKEIENCKDKKILLEAYLNFYSKMLKFNALLILSSLVNDFILSSEVAESIEKNLSGLDSKNSINIIQNILPLVRLSSIDFLFEGNDLEKAKIELTKLKAYFEPQILYCDDFILSEIIKEIQQLKYSLGIILDWDYSIFINLRERNFINKQNNDFNIKEILIFYKERQKNITLSPLILYDEKEVSLLLYNNFINSELIYEKIATGEKLRIDNAEWMEEVSEFLMRGHSYNFAIDIYRCLMEKNPNQAAYKSSLYAAYCYLGSSYYKRGHYEKSAESFEEAMKIKDKMPQLYYNLSVVYSKMNQIEKAKNIIRKLIVKNPDNPKGYEMLGDLYSRQNMYQQAISLYDKSLSLQSSEALKKKKAKAEERLRTAKAAEKKDISGEAAEFEKIVIDMNAQAELGFYHEIIGRDKELKDMIEVISCSHKNSLLIIGDAGVGKTALVEAFAVMLISEDLPAVLKNKRLFALNLGQLLAGAKYRGQLEERIINILQSIKQKDGILFIDDIHNIFSSTAKGSASDIASILRGWIIQGDIQCIGTTNYDEYRNTFEKDTSILRCFQALKLEELSIEDTVKVLISRSKKVENYHKVEISEEAIQKCVELSRKCLRERFLPDKAIEVLDRAAARAALLSLKKKTKVDVNLISEVVSDLSGIQLGKLTTDEKELFINLENKMRGRIIGQDEALSVIARVLRTAKANMELNPNRPKGVFLFIGPTGVGKTEVAKALAELLFGTEERLIRIDMSEYMERYSASRLIGTSPGYVGYYDQNQLVDKIRINPYSLILLDEIDKADPQLLHLFLQVFDAGRLTDGRGKTADFSNCTIIMTSNAGTQLFSRTRLGYDAFEESNIQVSKNELLKEVKRVFTAEFLNRIDEIVFFKPLNHDDIKKITLLKLKKVQENLQQEEKKLILTDEALSFIASQGYNFEYGARNLERVIRRILLDPLAMLKYHTSWNNAKEIIVSLKNNRLSFSLLPLENLKDNKNKLDLISKEANINKGDE